MLRKMWERKKVKIDNTIATIAKAKSIVRSSKRILKLAHELQDEYDLTETEVRLVFLNICEQLAKNEVTEFARGQAPLRDPKSIKKDDDGITYTPNYLSEGITRNDDTVS